ncbi:autophagy-related protein 13 homolog isoform X2 [Prorops nasuta]|uniref:autophagy-related protein 13 homolog isoform X2 n=1 Tax=Prorops nasuta TaxID=863751 RepID=UPI0034CFCDBE
MSAMKLSMQDKKDLEKFTRFLALKAAQIIVQSRSGEKVNTNCRPNPIGSDWFNLAVQEVPDVLAEAKKVLCSEIISSSVPLCIEISLRTVEGDTMVLENWSLNVLPEHSDPMVKVTYTVYNRMGTLLKSLLSISRVTPAYKLSRRQSSDSYIICYRIYMGEPQLHTLGENYKNIRVGQLCTPVGTIHLCISYRTKLTFSPTQTGKDSLMLKSDHFHSDLSSQHIRYQQREETAKSLSENVKPGSFPPDNPFNLNEEDLAMTDIPFSSLLIQKKPASSPIPTSETINAKEANSTTTTTVDSNNGNSETPCNDNSASKCNSQNGSRRSSCSMTSAFDSFIMKSPFAATNSSSDLGTFYRECQCAPQLQTFTEDRTLEEQVGDLTKQLETFEISMHQYEDMLSSLCQTENNN